MRPLRTERTAMSREPEYYEDFRRIDDALSNATRDNVIDVMAGLAAEFASMRASALQHIALSSDEQQAITRQRTWLVAEFDIAGTVYALLEGDDDARGVLRSQMVNSQAYAAMQSLNPAREFHEDMKEARALYAGLERDFPHQ
jgi:hypothetical protein